MLNINKVRYKNFLITGNVFTEIDFTKHKQTLFIGKNGHGKSTVIDALVYGLYGRAHRDVNNSQLINSINNKDMLVEVELNNNGSDFLIRRGMKPTIFEIYKNGVLVDQQAQSKDYQEYLKTSILGLDYKTFNQIVIIGKATYKPYMELSLADRRIINEDLLDVKIFTLMNDQVKLRIQENKSNLENCNQQMVIVRDKIQLIKKVKEQNTAEKQLIIDQLNHSIKKCNDDIETKKSEMLQLKQKLEECNKRLKAKPIESIRSNINTTKNAKEKLLFQKQEVEKQIEFFHVNDKCPTCRQIIDLKHKELIVNEQLENLPTIESDVLVIDTHLEKFNTLYNTQVDVQNLHQDLSNQVATILNSVKFINNTKDDYQKQINSIINATKTSDLYDIEDLEDQYNKLQQEQTKLLDDSVVLQLAGTLLKDTGLKAKKIKDYIPTINKLINKYLATFDFFVDFEFDENFQETIKSRHRDKFSYFSFSEGQKMRINLAILFAWREFVELKNNAAVNLLILDEVMDGSLEEEGIIDVLNIIQQLTSCNNTIIISHKLGVIQDRFDNVTKFTLKSNFCEVTDATQ